MTHTTAAPRQPQDRKPKQKEAFTEKEVAESYGVSIDLLKRQRKRGGGPPWIRLGAKTVRYPADGLRRWVAEQAVHEEQAGA